MTNNSKETTVSIPSRELVVIKRRGKLKFVDTKPGVYRNSLLFAVGFLELANAGDFAANVWNDIPVPTHAIVLMAIGATVALGSIYFAVKDAKLAWINYKTLKEERESLKGMKIVNHDAYIQLNFKEMGTELIERLIMDSIMGFGALLVGIGTYMAIGGANPSVFKASNLLSGYIGNSPPLIFSLINLGWNIYVWKRMEMYTYKSDIILPDNIAHALKRRVRLGKTHAIVSAICNIFGGAAAMVTSTMWWGYVVLVPVIILTAYLNYFWRNYIAYDRDTNYTSKLSPDEAIAKIEILMKLKAEPNMIKDNADNTNSVVQVKNMLSIIEEYDLIVQFCTIASKTYDFSNMQKVDIDCIESILSEKEIIDISNECIDKYIIKRIDSQINCLLEVLGNMIAFC